MRRMMRWMLVAMLLAAGAGTVQASENYERTITRAYEDILGRKPDTGGMRNYRSKMIDEGWSEQDVRNSLRDSAEYKNSGTKTIITRAYQDLLNRNPDSGGYEMYKRRIEKDGWSEADVRKDIRNSQEYRNKH